MDIRMTYSRESCRKAEPLRHIKYIEWLRMDLGTKIPSSVLTKKTNTALFADQSH